MMYGDIAWNNLLRNRRRTLSTLAAICIGVSMIVFTNGFTNGIAAGMSDSLVNQIDGHVRIQHRDYKRDYMTDQENVLIKDSRSLVTELMKNPHVRAVMPRVMTGGLIGKDEKTTTFIGMFSDLQTLNVVLPDYGKNLVTGKLLSSDDPDGVLIGEALAKSIGAAVGDELVLLSKTIQGDQSNALVHVRGTLTFPQDYAVEQSLIIAALGKNLREHLLDIGDDAATQLVLRIDDIKNVPEVETALAGYFEKQGSPWAVLPWYESQVYARVVAMFNGIGGVIMIVLTLMVAVITSNALLMAFFERIREIGTMRAIGMRTFDVYRLLYTETAIIAGIGVVVGLAVGAALVGIGALIGVPLSGIVQQEIHPELNIKTVMVSMLVPIICIVIVAAIPIRAANRMSVVDSLHYQ